MLTFRLDKLVAEKDFEGGLMQERDGGVEVDDGIDGVTLRGD